MIERILKLDEIKEDSIFLWGSRQTGKSTLLRTLFPKAQLYDLLKSDVRGLLQMRPATLREECQMLDPGEVVIIDEVQKVPALLDEVHWLIENCGLRFILSGSSARKLRRNGANLLGGRALRCVLFPLVSAEIPDFDLMRALNNGMLPRHYLTADPSRRIQSYIGDYLQQEIVEEAVVRNLDSFTAYTKTVRRKVIQSPKFYFFDVAIPCHMLHRVPLQRGTDVFGHAMEHFVIQELRAFLSYNFKGEKSFSYWRTLDNRYEVDAVVGDVEMAIEVKSSEHVVSADTKGLNAFGEEHPEAKLIIVSLESKPRLLNGVEVWPVELFLKRLWDRKII